MRSANNWLAFSLSPHLAIDAPDHASTAQSNGPKVARHTSADNGMAYNGSSSSEFYNTAESEEDGLPIRSDGSLCIMEAMSRSHSGDWPPQLNKTGHVQRSQHFLNAELSRFQGVGNRAASEQLQMSQTQYDSMNKTDPETVPKLEDFLGGATSLGGQYSTRSDSQTHNYDNLYMRDINVNLSPYSSAAQQQQQQAGHVSPSFHPYGIQRTDASSQQPYDTHSSTTAAPAEGNLCNTNVQQHARQNLLQVALDHQQQQQQHRHSGSGAPGGDLFIDCARQLPQGPNLSALKSWLQHNQAAAAPGSVNALGGAGAGAGAAGDNQPVGVGKSGIPTLANFQHSLSLSMSPGSQSSNTLQAGSQHAVQAEASSETRKRVGGRAGSKEASPRKSIDNFGQRTSVYRGVTRHRWTGRYEAHLWDNSCRKEGQTRKGRQVYLGGYDKEEKAARAYDLAALKYWGANTTINFPLPHYEKEVEEMKNMSRQEYVASLRRKSSGFSRGASVYRGVTRHHQHGRWQARIGRVAGNKDLYLGTYSTQEEAAEAYDIAAIKFRGINAVTNFDISRYDTNRICGTGHNPGVGETTGNEASAAGIGNNGGAKALPSMGVTGTSTSAQGGSGFGQVSAKELHLVVMPDQQRSEVSVDQTEDESQSLQTGNAASQGRDGGLMVSRPTSHLQDWQMLYQQQSHRSWDDPSSHGQQQSQLQQQHHQHHPQQQPQTHHHQSQDVRTQALMSMTDTKFMPTSNMHSTVLRNLIGLNEGGGSHSASETSGGLMGLPVSGHGSNNMLGTGHGGYGGAQQSPKGNSQLSLRESEDESSKTSGGGSAYENVLQGDFSRHIMYMSQKQSPPQGSQSSSVTNAGYDSSSIGGSSWMSPPASLSGRVNLGPGHMPIFAAWNE